MPSSSITNNNSVPILQLDNVHVIVSRKSVLSIDSFTLYPEDVYAVMGPNGAGKTTFLRTILKLQKNTSGKILFENEEITKNNLYKVRSQIGYIPQQSVINSEFPLTVRETVATGRAATIGIFHRFHASDWNLIDLWLEKLGLLQLRNRSINELSGGEQRKVLIARAMVQEPKLLLLDEPTANLDLYWREQIIQLIHSLYLQTKIAMIWVSHELDSLPPCCEKILLINDGKIHADSLINEAITGEKIQNLYGCRVDIHKTNGRYFAIPSMASK